jgi:gluconolactonase
VSTTNLAFGGADRRTLYVTEAESGAILIARAPRAGRKLFSDGDQAPRQT